MGWNTSKKVANFPLRGLIRHGKIKRASIFFRSIAFLFCRKPPLSILTLFLAGCSINPSSPGNEIGLTPPQDEVTKESDSYQKKGKVLEVDQTKSFEGGTFLDLLEAEIAGHRGDFRKALENYERVAVLTRDVGVLRRAFNIAIYLRENEVALRLARIWVAEEPSSVSAHSKIVENSLMLGLYDVALSSMKALKNLGGSPNFEILLIAMAKSSVDDKKKVLDLLEALVTSYPNDTGLLFTAANLYFQVSSLDKGLKAINVLLEESVNPKRLSLKTRILIAKGEVENAKKLLRSYLAENAKELGLRVLLAQILFDQRDFEKAKVQYQAALNLRPNDGSLLLSLAIVFLQQENDEDAEKILKRMIRSSLRVDDAYYHLAGIMERKKNFNQSLKYYKRVNGGYGFMPSQMRIVSLIEILEGFESSRTHLNMQRSVYPSISRNFSLLEAQFLSERRLFDDAIEVLDSELDSKPDDIELLYRKAMIGGEAGKIDILERALSRILEIDPDNADALNSLGYTLADKTDRYQEAFELVKRALSIRPEDPAFIDSMGWVYYRLNNLEKAIWYLSKALSLLQDDEIAAHLGEALWMAGRKSEALEVWENGLEIEPSSTFLSNVKKKFHKE